MKLFIFLVALGAARAVLYDKKLDAASTYDCPYCQPEQVHIAFGGNVLFIFFKRSDNTTGYFFFYISIYFSSKFSMSYVAFTRGFGRVRYYVLVLRLN